MGYDVENYLDPYLNKDLDWEVTLRFLSRMRHVHEDLNVPCTLFICGRLLEESDVLKALENLAGSEFFDLQQHTYSHQRLKTVVQDDGEMVTVFRGVSLEEIQKEVTRTNRLFEERLGVYCRGICGPYGYYRGLMDRPDILKVLYEAGIRFTRTYLRNENDWGPLSIDVQSFTYELQGFPQMLEIPSQGWQDIIYFRANGWNKREEFLRYSKNMVDEIVRKDLIWSVCQHDWTSCQKDAEMGYTRALLNYAQSNGITIISHRAYYEKTMGIHLPIDSQAPETGNLS